jgi:glycosyltransferase involved in cell wall biosynthesis
MKHVVVLRSNAADAGYLKILSTLAKEYRVSCLAWDRRGDYAPLVKGPNVEHSFFRVRAASYSLATLLKLVVFNLWLLVRLLFTKTDCIHAVDLDTGMVGYFVARLKGKAFVYHCLDPYYPALPQSWPGFLAKLTKKLEDMLIGSADFFVITDMLRMKQHGGSKPRKTIEFANVPMVEPELRTNEANDSFVVGYIGALEEGRNLLIVTKAISELSGEGVELVIGGVGTLSEEIRFMAETSDNISFTSYLPYSEVLGLESTFDAFIYVSDSTSESQRWVSPNKLFESMALGKPIVVGEGTLVAERVREIGNGVIIPYGDKEELKHAVLKLRADTLLAKDMGARGKIAFEKDWAPVIMEKRLLDAYEALRL